MSKRSGQTGQVFLRNDRWVGRSSLRTTSNYTHFGEAFIREIVEKLAAQSGLMDSLDKLDSVANVDKSL